MASVLVEHIVERILETTTGSYVNKDYIRSIFKDINSETSLDLLYKGYMETKDYLARIPELKSKCKSDYFYWGYTADEETSRLIERIYAEILFSKVNIDDITEVKMAYLKAQELDSIKAHIRDEIDGLAKYKPNGYKSKIELLNSLLGGNK